MTAEDFLNQYDPSNKRSASQEPVSSTTSFLDQYDPSINKNIEPESSGFLRQAADIPIQFAKGVGSAVRGYTDLFGADNEVSKSIAGYEDYMDSILSAESKKDSKRVSELLQKAKDGGFLDKVAAGFEAFASAPAEMTANTLGYMVPQVVFGVAGKAAQLSKAAQVGLTIGTGFAQGVGMGKGNIYQGTKDYLREQGVAEDQIEPIASRAQAYNGKNLDQLLLSGGLNALAASTGAEAILTRVLSKQGKDVGEDIIKGILKGVGAEAPIEGVQSAQEAIAPNIALQREGFDVPTFQGAIESATTGIVAGGVIGGFAGGIEAMSPEQKALTDIEKEANRRMRDLESDNPAAQALSTEITRLERGIDNKRQDLDALESTSPEANSLRLDIAADQKKLATLKTEAAKFGLSEPITTIEEQQAALAGEITKPAPKPLPTDVLPTETLGATYGREEQVYDVFGDITRKPVAIPKPAELPAAPTIEEQTAEGTYGGQTGVFDVFAGARRKPVEVAPAPVIEEEPMSVSDEKEFAELNDLMERKGQAENKVRGVKFTKQDQSRYQNLLTKFRDRLIETTDPKNDPVVGTDINGTPIQQSNKGTFYTFENGRVRTGPAFSEATPAPVTEQPIEAKPQRYVLQQIGATSGEWRTIQILPNKEAADAEQAKLPEGATGWRIIPETPVTEQAAPAEAPAPEVAPIERDVTKPEQMTPSEFDGNELANLKYVEEMGKLDAKGVNPPPREFMLKAATTVAHKESITAATKTRNPVSSEAVDEYRITLPEGYVKQGELYVYQPTPAVSETITEPAPAPKKRKGILGEQYIKKDWTNLTSEELPVLDRELGNYYGWAKGIVDKLIPNSNEFEKKALIMELRNEVTQETAKPEFKDRQQSNIAYNVAAQLLTGKRKKVLQRAKQRAMDDEYAAWEMGGKFDETPISVEAFDANSKGKPLPEGYTKQGDLYVYQPAVSETITPAAEPTGIAVGNRIKLGKSPQTYTIEEVIPQSETEKANNEQYYSVKNEKTGETQVVERADMKPVKKSADTRKTVVGDTQYQTEGVIPEDQRFTEDELRVIVNDIFGGKIPDKIKIITDTTDPNKEFKAAYSIRKGTITYNLAYLAKGDDLNFVTNHELGHYILGDPKFQGEMARLFDSLPPDIQEKLKKAIDEAYAQEGLGVRAEETIVFAFGEILENAPDGRNILQRFLDAIRDAINRLFKTEGYIPRNPKKAAAAILMAARNRFERGEFIKRPNGSVVNIVPDIRRMAVKKGQVASIKNAGAEKKTPKQIIARTRELLRKDFFNPSEVTEQNTLTAFRALGKLVGPKKEAAAYAEELNDIGRLVDEEGVASEVSMGAILFTNDLFEYSIKLAAEGQKMMLGIMMSNMNRLPLGEGVTLEESARAMRGALERSTNFTMMGQAEQDAFANYVAEFIYGPNPTKEQIQSIKDAYAAVEKTPQVTEQELTDEIKAVGDRAGTDLVGKINEEFTKATEKGKEKRRTEEQELDREYRKVQKQADAEIEKLAKIQSDTPSFDPAAARQTANDVRAIVANDLKQRPDMGRKAPWKSMLVAKLQEAGVELAAAETLADIVWRQHEINNLSRELSSINKAIEKGPISEIVKAIKDTPLEDQQNPNWRYEVMRDYLRKAGLPLAQAERIAKLMDISLQKRFTMAQEQAFTDAISKSAPWKTGDTRSRRAFQKVLQALRAGALDPARNVLSDMAALNGWTGFTPEQYKALLKYDAILANPETKQADLAEAHKAIQNIISKAKLPIRARDVIGQYYDAQALSGITTMTVNIFSPAGVAAKNALVQSLNGLVTARPEQITAAMTTFVDSIKSWANTVAYSFKNNVTVYSNVEYLVNDEGLLKLYNRGVDQFKNGKTPRDRADGVKNMMIGMMDYVRRVLNALDYGAIASLQNQAVSKYALAAMQAKGMSSKDGAKMLNAMMEQKRIFYNDQIAIGTDKNKAAVLADEFFISAWRQALTDAKLPAQEVIDAALNDAMSAVGRNRQSLDAFLEEETNTRDQGLLSFPAIWLLETMANAANKQDSQFIKIFSRIIYGFAIVPARVFREAAWFSPIGAYRFAYEYIAEKKGLKSRYSQSLGNDLQYRQRLTETIAGSIVMLAFGAAMSASTDDEDDEKPFKIVITGNGPLRNQDPQFYDSWVKKNRANTVNVYFGKTKFTINTMRGFEAFAWPAMMLGAVDDWHIRRKQGRTTNTPLQMQDGAIVAGNILSASLRRGPYAFAAKPLFEAYGDRRVESLAKSLAFPAKTLVPVLGSSLAKNISDFLNEPMDRRTLEGALWSNVPFIGPTIAPKALNAFGEPALASDSADKIFKLGVPIVYDIPNDRNSIMVHELVLKQGGGPSIPNRSQVAKRLDREPTNKEFEMFVKEYGAEIKRVMTENIEELSAMDGPDYDRAMEYIGNNARDMAQAKLMESK